MNNTTLAKIGFTLIAAALFLSDPKPGEAVSPITSIQAYFDSLDDPSNDFISPGAGSGGFPSGTTYSTRFTEGQFDNLIITSFDVGTNNYIFRQLAERIDIVRVANPTVTGAHHILLYDQNGPIVSGTNISLSSQFADTMEEILLANIINRGVDNVFCNTGNGDGNNNNIERIDYIFDDGYPAYGNLRKKGFMVMDRGGNDALQIAAILELSSSNTPVRWSSPVLLTTTNWGNSGITLDTIVYRGYDGNYRPSADVSEQPLTGQYIEWEEFGITTNTLVFGYTLVAADVPATQDWLNVNAFPLNTTEGSNSGGLDLMSGGALVLDERDNASIGDRVWNDLNQNGLQDDGEPGVYDVLVRVWDSTGTNLAGQARTDTNGFYSVYALESGVYQFEVVLPTNWIYTLQDIGPDDFIDSDVNTNTGRSGFIYLPPRTTNVQYDGGIFLPPTDLGVTKTVNSNDVRVGATVVFTMSVTNFGNYSTANVQLSDLLPAGLNYTGHLATVGTYTPSSGVWNVGSLAVGAGGRLVITARVDLASGGLSLTNTIAVTYQDRPDTNTANNTASAVVNVRGLDIAVGKSVSDDLPDVNELITYRVTVTNRGPDTATNVVVNDLLPAGITFSNSSVSVGSYNRTNGIWSIGAMTNGAVASLTITARVNNTSAGLVITNTATAVTLGLGDTNAANDSASAIITVIGADLGVTKTPSTYGPFGGSNLVYTIVLTNSGPSDTYGVTVSERLTNGLNYISHVASSGVYDNVSGIWTVGFMAAGAWATLDITAQATTNVIDKLVTNVSTIVSSTVADGNLLNNSATAIVAVSSLRISKSSSVVSNALPGSNITYTIVVTNAGSLTHTNVTVTDPLPDGVTYVTNSTWVTGAFTATNNVLDTFNSVSYSRNDGSENWANNWTESGETTSPSAGNVRIYTNAVRMSAASRGLMRMADLSGATNPVLSFNYRRAALDSSSDYVAVQVSSNGGSSYVEIGRIAGPNNDSSFLATNYNIEAFAATNTVLRFLTSSTLGSSDLIHFDNIDISWTSIGTNTTAGGAPPNLTSGHTLAPGQSITVTFTVNVINPATVTQIVNTAFATSLHQVLPIQASVSDPIAATDLGVTKSVNNANPNAGSNVVFTIVVTNNGPRTASNVVVADPLLAGFTYVTSTATRGSYSTNTGNWTVGTLTNNTAATLTLTARVSTNPAFSGSTLTNVATVTGSSLADLVPGNNSATVTVTVGAADLVVTKSVNNVAPYIGSNFFFTVAVSNAGPSPATTVQLTDIWPAGIRLTGYSVSQGTYATNTGIWTVGTLAAGGDATLTLNSIVTSTVVGVFITNRVYVSGTGTPDPNPNNNTGTAVIITSSSEPLIVSKVSSAGGTASVAGQAPPSFTNVYTIVVTNPNNFAHTGINVYDTVPTGMTYVASSTEISAPEYFTYEWFDDFRSRFYNNNFGNTNFVDNWDESESGDDPLAGNIQIIYDPSRGSTYSLRFQGGSAVQWIRRRADMSAFTNGTLSFAYRMESMEAGDVALLQVSSNGYNGTWHTLQRFDGPADDSDYTSVSFDLRPYLSTGVAFRIATTNTAMGSGDIVWIDDFRVTASKDTYTTRAGGLPPWLATNLFLRPGDSAIITYSAVVDNPASVTQVVNTASVTTDQQIAWISAAVTDRVELAETGIGKSVNDPIPDEGALIAFTITLTNHGPFTATDIVVQDLLPAGLTYVSNSASLGTYSAGNGQWALSGVTTTQVATLTLYATVNAGTAGLSITNTARILSQRQGDLNPTNNVASADLRIVPPFVITGCDFNLTNNAVEIFHEIVNPQQLYDLLYADAIRFSGSVTNWQLADRRAGGKLIDTGAVNRTPPVDLAEGMLRFYRISAPSFWEQSPRRGSVQVMAFGVARIHPGQNWVRPWGEPCDNTIRDILEDLLPGGDTAVSASRVMWFNRQQQALLAATQEVWMANGEVQSWICSYPREREGEVADTWPLPRADGFCVELPTNLTVRKLPMIYGVPTNAQIQVVPGNSAHALASVNLPETLHPAQMNLLQSGFQGATLPFQSDWLWKFSRSQQLVPDGKIWFKTSDQTWRFDAGGVNGALVPTNYFKPDDAIVIQRRAPTPMVWTNKPNYPVPTRDMNP